MSDFTIEQLKQLLVSLGDRLNHTKGDEEVAARLAGMEKYLRAMAQKIEQQQANPNNKLDGDKLASDIGKGISEELRKATADRPSGGSGGGGGSDAGDFLKMAFDKEAKGVKGSLGNISGAFLKAAGSFLKGSAGFIDDARNLSGSVSQLAKAFGAGSGAAMLMAKYMDENITAYQKIQSSAEGSITSIAQMHKAMSDASMTAEELGAAMTKGSDGARLLGAVDFAKFNKSFKDATRSVGFYGMNFEDITRAQSSYLDMMKNQGTLFSMDTDGMGKSLDQLVLINDKIAGILGKTRDEALQKAAEAARDPNYNSYMRNRGFTGDQMAANNQAASFVGQISPKLKDLFQQLSSGRGPTEDTATIYAQLAPEERAAFDKLASRGFEGSISPEVLQQFTDELKAATKRLGLDGGTMGLVADMTKNPQLEAINQIRNWAAGAAPEKKADAADRTGKDATTTAMMQLPDAIRNAGSALNAGANKVFDEAGALLSPALKNLIAQINATSDAFKDKVNGPNGLTWSLGSLGTLIAGGLGIAGLMAVIKATAVGVITDLGGIGKSMLGKLGDQIGSMFDRTGGAKGAKPTTPATPEPAKIEPKAKPVEPVDPKTNTGAKPSVAEAAKNAPKPPASGGLLSRMFKGIPGFISGALLPAMGGLTAHEMMSDESKPGNSNVASWINENIPGAARVDDLAYRASGGYVGTSMDDPRYSWNKDKDKDNKDATGKPADATSDLAKLTQQVNNFLDKKPETVNLEQLVRDLAREETLRKLTDGVLNAPNIKNDFLSVMAREETLKLVADSLKQNTAVPTNPTTQLDTFTQGLGSALENTNNILKEHLAVLKERLQPVQQQTQQTQSAVAQGVNSAASRTEVPLSVRDLEQPFDKLQQAMVDQLTTVNKSLDKIGNLLQALQSQGTDSMGVNREGYGETIRALEDIARSLKTRSIY